MPSGRQLDFAVRSRHATVTGGWAGRRRFFGNCHAGSKCLRVQDCGPYLEILPSPSSRVTPVLARLSGTNVGPTVATPRFFNRIPSAPESVWPAIRSLPPAKSACHQLDVNAGRPPEIPYPDSPRQSARPLGIDYGPRPGVIPVSGRWVISDDHIDPLCLAHAPRQPRFARIRVDADHQTSPMPRRDRSSSVRIAVPSRTPRCGT